ncbi:glycosyltransferase family 39 protein [Solidesulfovibrio sp.]|uniref:glycosyltransferase family 39 protein n=1 Tax=Solidesulfovibrio sp. TaxID=2910990 RepID=UPI002B1F18C8|nr:glycosyltransferase family 39 protein [Solidesulfovibrio sp.]MEA4856920.1 glycosyltransferase family 39 protein [Solidesulfovibrio sp.]
MKRSLGDTPKRNGLLGTLLALGAAYFLWRTWGRWGDIQVDFGRELYIAWQISSGKVLYRDLAYFNGPLSPYLNGLAMRVAAPSLTTILVQNCLVLLATSIFLVRFTKRITSTHCALLALYFFLAASAFNAVSGIGNYNSLTPYSHELTHGLLLLFAGVFMVGRFAGRPTPGTGFVCGLIMGLGFLTKPEMAVAIASATGLGLALSLAKAAPRPRNVKTITQGVVAGLAIPPLAALSALCLAMPPGEALGHLAAMWRMATSANIAHLLFYQNITGLSNPGHNLALAGLSLLLHLALFGYITCLGLAFSRTGAGWLRDALPVALLLATYLLLSPQQQFELTFLLPRSWPVLLVAASLYGTIKALGKTTPWGPIPIAKASLVVGATALSLKIFLNPDLYHYGALLLVPAGLVFTTTLVDTYPKRFPNVLLRRRLTLCAATFCLLFPLPLLRITDNNLMAKDITIQSPHGAITTDKRGLLMGQALDFLRREATPRDTVAVLPEGAMLNFLGGYANPTPYTTLMPPEWLFFGGDAIEAAFRDHPPDWIVLIHKSTAEYGYDFFGKGYGQGLWRFIRDQYGEQALFGSPPLRDDRYGILVLRRRRPAGAPPADGVPGERPSTPLSGNRPPQEAFSTSTRAS